MSSLATSLPGRAKRLARQKYARLKPPKSKPWLPGGKIHVWTRYGGGSCHCGKFYELDTRRLLIVEPGSVKIPDLCGLCGWHYSGWDECYLVFGQEYSKALEADDWPAVREFDKRLKEMKRAW